MQLRKHRYRGFASQHFRKHQHSYKPSAARRTPRIRTDPFPTLAKGKKNSDGIIRTLISGWSTTQNRRKNWRNSKNGRNTTTFTTRKNETLPPQQSIIPQPITAHQGISFPNLSPIAHLIYPCIDRIGQPYVHCINQNIKHGCLLIIKLGIINKSRSRYIRTHLPKFCRLLNIISKPIVARITISFFKLFFGLLQLRLDLSQLNSHTPATKNQYNQKNHRQPYITFRYTIPKVSSLSISLSKHCFNTRRIKRASNH